ncbi:MAG: energy transducer TonB [Thermodesulfobacteriota bacterium]
MPEAKPVSAPTVPAPAVPKAAAPPAPAAVPVDNEGRQRYLEELFGHIESRKHYPAAARRRRLEGGVEVSFVLTGAGAIEDLHVSGGHPMLQDAARKSLERSLPLPLPGDGVALPLAIRFHMEFRLR